MASESTPRVALVTPIGIARFPAIHEPDTYVPKEGAEPQVNFKTGLILEPGDPFIDRLRDMVDEHVATVRAQMQEEIDSGALKGKALADAKRKIDEIAVNYPFDPEYDQEGNETGRWVVKAKTRATYKDRRTGEVKKRVLPVWDAKANKLAPVPAIWSGSKLRLSAETNPYYIPGTNTAGISLRLTGVKVLDLVTGNGGTSARALGLDGEEEGYEASLEHSGGSDDGYADGDY